MPHPMDIKVERPWWRRKPLIVVAAVVAGAFVLWLGSITIGGAGGRSLTVPAEQLAIGRAEQTIFHDVLPLTGETQPKETIDLDAVEGGQIEALLVKPGDRVSVGQPLVRFRNAQLELDVLNNAGRLIASVTQLQSFETQLENNRATNDRSLAEVRSNINQLNSRLWRIDRLVARGFYPRGDAQVLHDQMNGYREVERVQKKTNLDQERLRLAQLPQIRAEQVSLRASLEATHAQLGNLVVRSPVVGTLTQMDLRVGQNRNRGDRLGQITTDAGFKIVVKVDQYYLSRVRIGQRGRTEINGRAYQLIVSRVVPDVVNGAFTAELEFEGAMPTGLTTGASVQVSLALGADQRALIIPTGAFMDTRQGDTLFVLDDDGERATRRPVRLGRHTDRQVEVLSGLNPGERVITSDYSTYGRVDVIRIHR